ncbi:MAG TPA: ChuX/HutX family heme-like substrate-binding protein [Amaricoccus sp.]|uniref:hemin-degrading factor n=2 Tax=Amaricoccus sp. TaxID=1872485 RepID=UPI002BF0184C|nr:ChuX/HutX family heme-like substrate-binding protein [Amaricoccus sp.]HMR51846.1 ChuX/HutX family heme-like substrate-binding protein [Amaricoccus sp.]HMR60272.1 ChuX/HutX family heme-like substrate-binding protein [Amaricoccus sp.]HMU01391.1 ChuX/HutX family heme-like substrate-binding protein [Amaricoccus sp.]
MAEAMVIDRPEELLAREAALRNERGRLRMRDAAAALGVPEAALVEARRATGAALRLARPDAREGYGALLAGLPAAGEVMALTRNESCVIETHGRFDAPEFQGAMGQVVGEIDLRLFTGRWAHAYLLEEETPAGPRRSLQFFDGAGLAMLKVYATAATDAAAFRSAADAASDAGAAPARFEAPPTPAAARPDAAIDAAGLRAAWDGLGHTHEFFGLLRRFDVGRAQAMRLAGPERARPAPRAAMREALSRAAAGALPVMVFVGNPGCVQIRSGTVERIETMGPWLNVLDPRFNLHLREDRIAEAFVVRKPSVNGDIHSLELYDEGGEVIVQVFGLRRAGERERADWRALVTGLGADAPC